MNSYEITVTYHIEAESKEDAAETFFTRDCPAPTHITVEGDDGREYEISGPDGEVGQPRPWPRFA